MRWITTSCVLTFALFALACEGRIESPAGTDDSPDTRPWGDDSDEPIGTAGLRRLSPLEAETTVRDLFVELGVGEVTIPPTPLPAATHRHGFQNPLDPGHLTFEQVRGLVEWAEGLSALVVANPDATLGCAPSATWDPCVRDFARELTSLAFRRPLADDEVALLESTYVDVVRETTPEDGVRALVELALVSPDFWYVSAETVEGESRLAPHAIASQLAYGLWGTMPDAWLRAQELDTRSQVRAVADAMLDDPRAEATIARFHRDWLNLASPSRLDKDPALYPDFDAETAQDLETEMDAFVTRSVLEDRGIDALFASRDAFVNQRLERLYGLDPVSSGDDDWVWRELGPERAGILTRPLFLATTAGRGESALIHRGVAVIEHLLCRVLTAPANATAEAIPIPPDASSGKLAGVTDRASKPHCATCHDTIDPLGLAFESFDAIGAFRTEYPDGVAIDPAGTLDATFLAAPITYDSSAELLDELSRTSEVQLCYATKWSEWLTGHPPNSGQRSELERITSSSDLSIRELLLETLVSPLFLDRAELVR